MLSAVKAYQGIEVHRDDWPTAEALEAAGEITLGTARGPNGDWRRAYPIPAETGQEHDEKFVVGRVIIAERPKRNRAKLNFDPHRAPRGKRDWHVHWNETEPKCGADQWRTRDRDVVMYMHEMEDRHLGHCIRFASTKSQHASRLASLLAERARRSS